jgi:hypothetical protein
VAVISVSDSGGEFGTISFSSSTGLPVKATVKVLINALKLEEFERTILFTDYRKTGTMLAPFTIAREDGSLRITVSSYSVNPRIPLDLYQSPTTEEQLKRIIDYRGPTGGF